MHTLSLHDARPLSRGYVFLEAGVGREACGYVFPFSLSFDVIAHEVGHCIVYSQVGVPFPHAPLAEYLAFHESAADMTALIQLLHVDSGMDDLLEATSGNTHTFNALTRVGELSQGRDSDGKANSE